MQLKKISIIGGGIGGLMTAIALNKKGLKATLFEKSIAFDNSGAGLALWPNATTILNQFGLLNNSLPIGNILQKLQTCTSKGRPINVINLKKLEDKFNSPSIVLLRADLQKELLNASVDSQIQYNKKYVSIENNLNNVITHFDDGNHEISDAVIFADGIHSAARKTIFNIPSLKYAGRTSWRGIAYPEKNFLSNDTSFEFFGNGRRMGIFPLPNDKAYWYAAVNMNEQEARKQNKSIECVLSHFQDWAEPANTVIKKTLPENLILTNINYTTEINQLVTGNIALLGDAAHPMTPDLGQGACQAIEDAVVIAECLSQNKSVAACLKDYEVLRLKRVKSIARNSFRIGKLRQLSNPVGVFIRNNLFKFMPEKLALKMLERNIYSTLSGYPD